MGSKPSRGGKQVLLYLACCLSVFFFDQGCVPFFLNVEGKNLLFQARNLKDKGEYASAVKVNEEVLRDYPLTLGDQALMQLGILYADPRNPDADYARALERFERLLAEYPGSDLRRIAESWVLLLRKVVKEIDQLKDRTAAAEKELEKKSEAAEAMAKELQNNKADMEAMTSRLEAQKSRIASLEGRIDELLTETAKLTVQIEKLKQIDLGVEKKKRKAMP